MPKHNQVQDARIEHDLDPHQHDDRVLARQIPAQANGDQERRQHQIMIERNVHRLRMTSSSAMTTAPISAAVSSTAIASNGTTQSAPSALPISATEVAAVATGNVCASESLRMIAQSSPAMMTAVPMPAHHLPPSTSRGPSSPVTCRVS